ncbi:hypothetical protein CCM_00796 [Cordyceps militaris CM01]|uniref:Uncharacterized protein n=1 Tax=Cordyceps militaris (strain CM01) TaxID=983644 RepID=G3J637_CORMM|nr:uncharacterized protein CCM_00796 [Cordyceps militaris CM01]EGX96141.1 hypothetical protein CCM_00796 [Cordyceps militaris CM01]
MTPPHDMASIDTRPQDTTQTSFATGPSFYPESPSPPISRLLFAIQPVLTQNQLNLQLGYVE